MITEAAREHYRKKSKTFLQNASYQDKPFMEIDGPSYPLFLIFVMVDYEIETFDYNELINPNANLSEKLKKALGSSGECLGICFVKNVPDLKQKRTCCLIESSKLAAKSDLDYLVNKESSYLIGWSHGREIMNGKPDLAKGIRF